MLATTMTDNKTDRPTGKKKLLTAKSIACGFILYCVVMIGILVWGSMNKDKAIETIALYTPAYMVDISGAPKIEQNTPPVSDTPITAPTHDEVIPESTSETSEDESAPSASDDMASNPQTETSEMSVEPTEPVQETEISAEPLSYDLTPAPVDAVSEKNEQGLILPRRAKDGRVPWRVYSRPFNTKSQKPRISIIISDMGLSTNSTEKAIAELPPEITLAFVPYAGNLDEWVKKSREAGHEVLLSIPMEPETYPKDDPGPNALLTTLSKQENINRLNWALSRATGYVGIMNFMGSRYTSNTDFMADLLEKMYHRGLMIVDAASSTDSVIPSLSRINGVPYSVNDRYIDNIASRQSIDKQLKYLEDTAVRRGYAIGIAFPYPITFEQLNKWVASLKDKNIELAPITAVASEEIE